MQMSLVFNAEWKNFDFSMMWNGQFGNKIYNVYRWQGRLFADNSNYIRFEKGEEPYQVNPNSCLLYTSNYSNLPYGSYTLRIKGSHSDGKWNATERVLDIHIRPPFYLSTWAYAGYTAVSYTHLDVYKRQIIGSVSVLKATTTTFGRQTIRTVQSPVSKV